MRALTACRGGGDGGGGVDVAAVLFLTGVIVPKGFILPCDIKKSVADHVDIPLY